MSLELLGAVEVRAPIAEVQAIGTDAERLDAEEQAIAEAAKEVERPTAGYAPIIIGASIGSAIAGPFGGVLGAALGWILIPKDDESKEDRFRRMIFSEAARKSPTLMRARRAAVARQIAGIEGWTENEQVATDADRYYAALASFGGYATLDEVAARSGLTRERAIAARERCILVGAVRPLEQESQTPLLPARPDLRVIDGDKGKSPDGGVA